RGLARVVVDQVVVGGREGGKVRRRLLVATLGVRTSAVDGQGDHPDDRAHREDEDSKDLPAGAIAARTEREHWCPSGHWILALLAVAKLIGPNGASIGRIGWNDVRTETFTQSPGWHDPLTAAPAMSMQS